MPKKPKQGPKSKSSPKFLGEGPPVDGLTALETLAQCPLIAVGEANVVTHQHEKTVRSNLKLLRDRG